jgi:hypothetical protein
MASKVKFSEKAARAIAAIEGVYVGKLVRASDGTRGIAIGTLTVQNRFPGNAKGCWEIVGGHGFRYGYIGEAIAHAVAVIAARKLSPKSFADQAAREDFDCRR